MEGVRLGEIAEVLGAKLRGDPDSVPTGASVDSRTIRKGEIFFALRGERTDGHKFVGDALRKGASAAVVRRKWMEENPDVGPLLGVDDPLKALGKLGAWYRRRFKVEVVAVTGSSGKTTVKEMTAAVLGTSYNVLKSEGSWNNEIGLPLTLLMLSGGHDLAVVELGMNAPGEIRRLAEMARPCVGTITNVGPAHIGAFGSLEGVARAKGELLEVLEGKAVLNWDDPWVRRLGEDFAGEVIWFGLGEGADLRAEEVRLEEGRPSFVVEGVRVKLEVLGRYQVYNALASLAIGISFGISLSQGAKALEKFRPPPLRCEVKDFGGIKVLLDCYNANPTSVKEALKLLSSLPGRRIAVLGDMLELGDEARRFHREVGAYAARCGIDLLLCTGRWAEDMAAGAGEGRAEVLDREGLVRRLRELTRPGDKVLVKASRRVALEEVVERAFGEI